MSGELAPQYEAFIQDALAAGTFPSREKLLEAAVESLREQQSIQMIPEEHMAAVEEAVRDSESGRLVPGDVEDAVQRMYARQASRRGA